MKYKSVDELKIGMKVTEGQIEDILDTYIILDNAKIIKDGEFNHCWEGVISAISKEKIYATRGDQVLIFNDSFPRQENCCYE